MTKALLLSGCARMAMALPALPAKAYDYYWTSPYRPQRWRLEQ
ncbi:hypothetical protein EV663_101265 [Rhodovulum bhavnagarense]|uniref:Uncharacterized protein n=1 Tax=Rhodovulum bhavnagarense TaxID=992286 RepID=A0A4R2RH29_9RHOB|nr:hypothetical protein [Rhodovulum bhavnagarense]TCP63002.1 hypothetical protein EV663_101265 [Rhodovulum bhavnagarense]